MKGKHFIIEVVDCDKCLFNFVCFGAFFIRSTLICMQTGLLT